MHEEIDATDSSSLATSHASGRAQVSMPSETSTIRVSEGNHRIHTARMLNLSWLAASVNLEATPPPWRIRDLIDTHPTRTELRQPLPQRLNDRAAHIAGLIRRGVIDGTLSNEGPEAVLHCRRLPAHWLLRGARDATAMNTAYESRYPGAVASHHR